MNTAVCSAALIRQAVLGRGSIPGRAGVDLGGGQCSGESAGQEACAKEPSLGSRGPGPSARDNVAGIPGALHASTTRPVALNIRRTLWAGRALDGHSVSTSPVTSASSHDGFSRALWQDLECVCVCAGR